MKSIATPPTRRLGGAFLLLTLALVPVVASAATIIPPPPGTARYSPTVADGTLFDATAYTNTSVSPSPQNNTAVEIFGQGTGGGGNNLTWMGGIIQGSIPTTWGWTETHSFGGAGVVMHNNGPAEWRHIRIHNVEDGMKPREAPEYSNTASWMLRDCYWTAIRDDCIENDRFEPGTVQDCLFDGVHTFYSEQNENVGSNDPIGPNESNTVFVKRVYVRIYPTNAFDSANDQFPGGGKWFKIQGPATEWHNVSVEDSVFAVGTVPRSGWSNLNIPSQVTWVGTNNFILWLGAVGAYQGPRPANVQFLEGTAATNKWTTVRNAWLTAHGLPTQNFAADYNPHTAPIAQIPTSVDTTPPAAPTGLTATPGNAQVVLDWANNTESDLAGYNVYRGTTSGGPYTLRNGSLLTTSAYTDSATNGTTYYYVVTAVDNSANESADSAQKSATPTAGPPSVYDANALTIAGSSGKTVDSVSNGGASGGNFLRYHGNAVNDWISFTVNVPSTTTYTIAVRYAKIPYGGKVQLSIDGTNQGSLTDTYAASTTLASFTLGTKSLSAGNHTFKFQSPSKNASSSGYYVAIDTITLTP